MTSIHLLERDNNRKGDLFNRVIRDLCHALGYDPIRVNVHKTGREIDLLGQHRIEIDRHIRAECKATSDPIGGGEINKFIGALDAERRQLRAGRKGVSVSGYYISIAGFRDSAIEQEEGFSPRRITLLNGRQVVNELIHSRIIVSREQAIDSAGRLSLRDPEVQFETADLLIHELGMAWIVYYCTHNTRSHFALIHAGGTPLAQEVARKFVLSAEQVGIALLNLTYVPPVGSAFSSSSLINARERYFAYLEAACGDIQLDGLPADEQIGTKRLRLENLFVPLHIIESKEVDTATEASGTWEGSTTIPSNPRAKNGRKSIARISTAPTEGANDGSGGRIPVGSALATNNRIALLAAPGGGKSTLLKRIAVAYVSPERRLESSDNLPDRDWFPMFIRCRELGSNVREPIRRILSGIGDRAELDSDTKLAFDALTTESLASGRILLLIDGLDEITDDGDRVAFVTSLRTFSATYASVSLVVTSREAGFRAVAGAMAPDCIRYRLDDLADDDIRTLVGSWHTEVYGDSAAGRFASAALAESILSNDRIRRLAGNPLLLTTLLLVRRWVGQLPTKRTVLYEKAIEVLLMTWNVQAHAPMSLDEALPRLKFVAYTMLHDGAQTISRTRLCAILEAARKALPEVLGYSELSDSEFIDRVELRSSLLIQAGHDLEAGRLVPLYEFRHLTFQEYLAARAIVDGHYPGRSDSINIVDVLQPYFEQKSWFEVIPMAAVLAGRDAKGILRALAQSADPTDVSAERDLKRPGTHLISQCLVDEVQLAPADLDSALLVVVRDGVSHHGITADQERNIRLITAGKYGGRLTTLTHEQYFDCPDYLVHKVGAALGNVTLARLGWSEERLASGSFESHELAAMLMQGAPIEQAAGALVIMEVAYTFRASLSKLENAIAHLPSLLRADHPRVQSAAAWALAWLGARGWQLQQGEAARVIRDLASILYSSDAPDVVRRDATWAICELPVHSPGLLGNAADRRLFVHAVAAALDDKTRKPWPRQPPQAAVVLNYYLGQPLTKPQLAERIFKTMRRPPSGTDERALEMLRNLGRSGEIRLRRLKASGQAP